MRLCRLEMGPLEMGLMQLGSLEPGLMALGPMPPHTATRYRSSRCRW
jgi:hypothetical protein